MAKSVYFVDRSRSVALVEVTSNAIDADDKKVGVFFVES
jgi:hypothetical protein